MKLNFWYFERYGLQLIGLFDVMILLNNVLCLEIRNIELMNKFIMNGNPIIVGGGSQIGEVRPSRAGGKCFHLIWILEFIP
jgi:hypothetical protein